MRGRGRRKATWLAMAAALCALPASASFSGTVGQNGLSVADSPPPPAPKPLGVSQSAPNILLVMIDDAGYGQFGTFGGAVPSPAFDALAAKGLRFTRFHTAGICSPTRAALLTGRNPHNAGFGNVGELSNGYDGYTGVMPNSTSSFVRVLRDNGYSTGMFGKNHNTPAAEGGPAGPFTHWPTGAGMGFDYFYGFNGWGSNQYSPTLFENTRLVPPKSDPDYTLNADLADHTISWIRQVTSSAPGRPFMAYLATGATHAPHQVPKEWIDRFKGQFDSGWDAYREAAFARQKKLGVIPADAVLTPRPADIPAWDSLTPDQKRIAAREMEVFAGFSAQTEYEVGRVIAAAQAIDNGRPTVVITILGDNGASAEGGILGTTSEVAQGNGLLKDAQVTLAQLDDLGGPKFENHMAYGWAWAVDTPFRYYKQVVSHLGAVRNPMIVSWPGRVKDPGATRSQFLDVTDLAPTLLDAAGLKMPAMVDGTTQKPLDGVDAMSVIDSATAPEVRVMQYFEVFGNRAIYYKGWMASAMLSEPWILDRSGLDPMKVKWELYNLDADFSQSKDLADVEPDRLAKLEALWWAEAGRNNVLPLNWNAGAALAGLTKVPPPARYVFYPGTAGIPERIAPNVRNRSWSITAKGNFTSGDTGMIVTQGGMPGGWAFYLNGGRPVFDYNLQGVALFRVASSQPVPAGARQLEMRFQYDGPAGARGAGGSVILLADGKELARGRIPRTLPAMFSVNETFDVGADYGSPVALDYPFPAPFKGDLKTVELALD